MIRNVNTFGELVTALQNQQPLQIILQSTIVCPFSITLPSGFSISGGSRPQMLCFNIADGLGLTHNNTVSNLIIQVNPSYRAIYLAGDYSNTKNNKPQPLKNNTTITLRNLTITGQVQIITRTGMPNIKLVADAIDIVSCDARRYPEQPQGYGVNVIQGAFTVYNFSSTAGSVINASLTNISLGRQGAPVIGSGLFLSGYGPSVQGLPTTCGGTVEVSEISTGNIYSNGMLPADTMDMISAAVSIGSGVTVEKITHLGSVTTYGTNDMVLDSWGTVKQWVAQKPITSFGPSSIGLVNFGEVDEFRALDKIETFGAGSRGFNQYVGTIKKAAFHSITTHGNGGVGIQISVAVGSIEVKNSISTNGSVGQSLIKGKIAELAADAVSVETGGTIQQLIVGGDIITSGAAPSAQGIQLCSLSVNGGIIKKLTVKGVVKASGNNSNAIEISNGGTAPLDNITAISAGGIAVLVCGNGQITSQTGLKAKGKKGNLVHTKNCS